MGRKPNYANDTSRRQCRIPVVAALQQVLVVKNPLRRLLSAYQEVLSWTHESWYFGDFAYAAENARKAGVTFTGCAWPDHLYSWQSPPISRVFPPYWPDRGAKSCLFRCWCPDFVDLEGRPKNISAREAALCGSFGWVWGGLRVVIDNATTAAD